MIDWKVILRNEYCFELHIIKDLVLLLNSTTYHIDSSALFLFLSAGSNSFNNLNLLKQGQSYKVLKLSEIVHFVKKTSKNLSNKKPRKPRSKKPVTVITFLKK